MEGGKMLEEKLRQIEEDIGEVMRELNERINSIEEIATDEGKISSFMAGKVAGLTEALTIVELHCEYILRGNHGSQ